MQVGSAMASETVALLRCLMGCEGWAAPLQPSPEPKPGPWPEP